MIVYPPSRHPDTQQHATLSSGRVAGNHRHSNSFALPFDPWPADDRDIDIGEESSPTTMVQRNPKDINRQLEVEVLNENDGVEDILHPIESDLSSSAPPSRLVQAVSSSFGSSSFQYQETAINFSSHSPITNTIFSGSSALHVVSQEIAIVSTVSTLDPSLLPYYSSDADTTRSEDEESAAASSLDGSLTPILMLDGQYSQQSSLLPLAASVGEEFAHAMDVAEQEVEEAVNNLVSLSSSSSRVKPLFIDVSGNDVSHLVGRPNEEPIPFEMIDSLQDVIEEGATREVYDHDDEDDEHEEVFVEDVTVDTVATDNEVDLVESSTVLLLPPVEVSIEEEVIVSSMPTISATGVATKPSTPRHSLADIDTDDDQLGEHSSLPMDKTVAQQATSSPLTTGTSSSITPVKPGLGIRRESLRSSKSRPSSQEQEVTPPVASSGPIQPSISQSTAKDSSTGTHCGSDDDDVVDRLPQQSASEPFVSCDVIRSRLRELLNGEIEPLNKQVTTKPSPLVSGRRMLTQKALLEEIGYPMRTDTTAPQQTLQRFLKAQGETSGVTNPVYPIAVKYFEMRDRDVLRQNKKNMGERKRERELEPHSVQQGIDIGMNLDNPLFETQAAIKRMREPLNEFNGDDDMASEEHMEASCPSQPMTTSTTGQRTMSTIISETLPGIVEQMKVADEMKMPLLDDLLADMAVSLPHATGRGSNSSVHTTELDNLIVYDNCDEVRMKVNNFLRDYSCSVYRFSAYLGMSSTTLSGFLVKVGPDSGASSIAYERAYYFFEKYRIHFNHTKSSKRLQKEIDHPQGYPHGRKAMTRSLSYQYRTKVPKEQAGVSLLH